MSVSLPKIGAVRWLRPAGFVLSLVATAYLVTAVWSLAQSGRGADHDLAVQRDELSRTAVRQIALLNSVDPKRLDLDLSHWLEEATGPFRDALQRDMGTARVKFAKQTAPSRGQVTALAITALDTRTGTATILASVRVQVGDPGAEQPASEQRKRYQAGMERGDGGWKIKTLTPLSPAGPPAGGSRP